MNDWILFRPRAREDEIWLEYEDDAGVRWPAGEALDAERARSLLVEVSGWKVRIINDLKRRLAASIESLPDQTGPHATGRSPFPIFVGGTPSVGIVDALRVAAGTISRLGCNSDMVELVTLARDTWIAARPFHLPLRIGWSGTAADAALAALRGAPWIDATVREHALQIASTAASPGGLAPNVLFLGRDASAKDAWTAVTADGESLPRLVVSFDAPFNATVLSRSRPLMPQGQSLIDASGVPAPKRNDVVKALVYGIVHDQPLHEVVKSAVRSKGVPLTLFSDPVANHSLRLSDALLSIFEEAKELSDRIAVDRNAAVAFLSDLRRADQKRRRPADAASKAPSRVKPITVIESIEKKMGEIWTADISFDEEVRGLAPMALLVDHVKRVRGDVALLDAAHARAEADPAFRRKLYPREERRADIALLRRDLRGARSLFVPKESTLAMGSRYRVRVQIGKPLAESIMVGNVPSIDAFLPLRSPKPGHVLTVVLYALDFASTSPPARTLILPPHGPSDAVLFDVVAPRQAGAARMRVGIYYELPPELLTETDRLERYYNQLVQSFIILAEVERVERRTPSAVTTARVEVSRRVRFEGLQSLTPRLASLGLNEAAPGRHTFLFKRGSEQGHANITEPGMNEALRLIRRILSAATYDKKRAARFVETDLLIRGGQRETDFDDTIRKLARAGHGLHKAVHTPLSEKQQTILDDITAAHDKVVQIIRYNANYVFTWSLLYDFPRPPEKPGKPSAEVCKGFLRQKDGKPISCGDCLAECLHPDKTDAFCVWGFWGFRHSVEQVLHAPNKEEATIQEVKSVRARAVAVDVGIQGHFANVLTAELQTALGKHCVLPIAPPRELVSTLWSDDRPAIAIILGHYKVHRGLGPGIQIAGNDWLMLNEIADQKTKWSDPHSVVVLAACRSAAADLATLVSFVNEFANARASAVIGTETAIFEGLACRFAKALATDLMNNATLGQAVLEFRRSVLRLLNPLGLVVTAYGDADLHLT